jgi:uncharacterized protein (DUF1919 family)
MSLKTKFKEILRKADRRRLCTKEFTIISSNCWGAEAYKEFGIAYLTPFVGLFLFPPCYLRLLGNLKDYLSEPLSFIDVSRYEIANERRKDNYYPIGLLGEAIEIHFMHYSTISDAQEKWKRRVSRINWDNIFVEFSDRDSCNLQHIEHFEKLQFKKKICFTAKRYPQFKSTVWIEECRNETTVPDGKKLYTICKKYFDIIDWLNGGDGHINALKKAVNAFIYI